MRTRHIPFSAIHWLKRPTVALLAISGLSLTASAKAPLGPCTSTVAPILLEHQCGVAEL
jgi:hypothetical protein